MIINILNLPYYTKACQQANFKFTIHP